jgi:hypothetical protein
LTTSSNQVSATQSAQAKYDAINKILSGTVTYTWTSNANNHPTLTGVTGSPISCSTTSFTYKSSDSTNNSTYTVTTNCGTSASLNASYTGAVTFNYSNNSVDCGTTTVGYPTLSFTKYDYYSGAVSSNSRKFTIKGGCTPTSDRSLEKTCTVSGTSDDGRILSKDITVTFTQKGDSSEDTYTFTQNGKTNTNYTNTSSKTYTDAVKYETTATNITLTSSTGYVTWNAVNSDESDKTAKITVTYYGSNTKETTITQKAITWSCGGISEV